MSSAQETASDGIDITQLIGAVYFGGVVSFMMTGVTVVQYWTFLMKNRKDSLGLRTFVTVLVGLDIACAALVIAHLHERLILHFGSDILRLFSTSLFLQVETFLTTCVIAATDLFLANQVRGLGQAHWIIPLAIAVTAVAAFCISFAVSIISLASSAEDFFASNAGTAIIASSNSLFTVAEFLAAGSLAWSIQRSKTGIRRTDGILFKLFTWMVTRGILLSIIQLLSMLLYFGQPQTLNWIPFHFFQSKLYVITTLSMLNSRKTLRRQINIFTTTFTDSHAYDMDSTSHSHSVHSRSRQTVSGRDLSGHGRNPRTNTINIDYDIGYASDGDQDHLAIIESQSQHDTNSQPESPIRKISSASFERVPDTFRKDLPMFVPPAKITTTRTSSA